MLSWFKKKNTPNAPAAAPPTTHPHPQASVDKSPFLDQAKYFSTILRQSPKIIFDVGANIGDTSAQFAKIFPDAQIFAFEPCEETFQQLSTRFADTPQIHPLQLALSETHGRSQFFTYRNSAVNSLLPIYENSPVDSPDDVKDKIVCTVHTQTIDAFMAESGIDRVDILKLDVQGGETRALNGATQALAEHRIALIAAEVNFCSVYEGQAWYFDVAKLLHDHRYAIRDLYYLTYTENGALKWGDAVFVPMENVQADSSTSVVRR